MKRMAIVESVVRDGRHAARVLRKSPGFAGTAVLTLGLAIAVNTAVFSVVDSVLLKRLPYPEPDRLAMLTTVRAGGEDIAHDGATWALFRDHASTLMPAVYSSWPTGVDIIAAGRAAYVQ